MSHFKAKVHKFDSWRLSVGPSDRPLVLSFVSYMELTHMA